MKMRVLCSVVLAVASAPAFAANPSVMEGRWRSDLRDVVIVDIVTCGKGYCGQLVLPSGCGETVLRLVETKALEDQQELEGSMTVLAEKHTYKAYALFDNDNTDGGPHIFLDGFDELPSYEHREFPYSATFFRVGAAACRTVPTS